MLRHTQHHRHVGVRARGDPSRLALEILAAYGFDRIDDDDLFVAVF